MGSRFNSFTGGLIRKLIVSAVFPFLFAPLALGFTANQVVFEFRSNGVYRVIVAYTVPELKEFREVYVDFKSKKQAEKYYFDLIRGADFYLPAPEHTSFQKEPGKPRPW